MIVRPDLATLRCDPASQRRTQVALERRVAAWRTGEGGVLVGELERFAAGAPLGLLPLLGAMFVSQSRSGAEFAARAMGMLLEGIGSDPLAIVPLGFASDRQSANLVLGRSGTASLTLVVHDRPRTMPGSASFSAATVHETVIAGAGSGARISVAGIREDGGAQFEVSRVALRPGVVDVRDGARTVLAVTEVSAPVVTLRLYRREPGDGVVREFRLADGAVIDRRAANPRDSRIEIAGALLARMGRTDAAPLLVAIAEEAGPAGSRWQALREAIGLDTGAGFAALSRIAARVDDPLAVPAGALRAQLLEAYPVLASLADREGEGVARCPA